MNALFLATARSQHLILEQLFHLHVRSRGSWETRVVVQLDAMHTVMSREDVYNHNLVKVISIIWTKKEIDPLH